ncbi:hypothetical protein AACH06_13530 [Ideonella sp. DXS29W]|uniref:SGNH/GDSL hydrolase family protein n=1 Tax=Ideonella lacteola TaxID=2984193 RepID=A0ABU9BTL8_9BURK
MKVFLTGDSHLGALRRALLQPDSPNTWPIDFTLEALGRGHLLRAPFFADRGDHAEILDADFRKRVRKVPSVAGAFDAIGISGPLNTARVWRDEAFATFRPYPLTGRTPISRGMLRAIVEDDVRQTLEFIRVVRRNSPVFVIDSPWPFARHPSVMRIGIEVVQHVHRWYREYVMAELASMDVPIVDIDPSCLDKQGFMLERFRNENARDLYHANAAFGKLMLQRIVDRFAPAARPVAQETAS